MKANARKYLMKRILTALTLSAVLASPAWLEERQFLCTSEHMVGYGGRGNDGAAYGSYRIIDMEAKAGKYVLKVDGDQLSLKVVSKIYPRETGNSNCGYIQTAVNNI
jgi:hypothetical protein